MDGDDILIYIVKTEKRKYPYAIETIDGREISHHLKYECAVDAEKEYSNKGIAVQVVKYRG